MMTGDLLVPLSVAARKIDRSQTHTLRVARKGFLDLVDRRLPGARRPRWFVKRASLDKFLAMLAGGVPRGTKQH